VNKIPIWREIKWWLGRPFGAFLFDRPPKPPNPPSYDELVAAIRSSPFVDRADRLIASLSPSILMHRTRAYLDDLQLGQSRLGGVPDVPADFEWPRLTDKPNPRHRLRPNPFLGKVAVNGYDKPMDFLVQLNLADLTSFDTSDLLPQTGSLLFFIDQHYDGPWPLGIEGCCVRHIDAGQALHRFADKSVLDAVHSYHCFTVEYFAAHSIPHPDDALAEQFLGEIVEEEIEALWDLHYLALGRNGGEIMMLGYPSLIQNDIRSDCELLYRGKDPYAREFRRESVRLKLEKKARHWRMLLQLKSGGGDHHPGWTWNDGGSLWFMIREKEARKLRFDRVCARSDCY
jgi:uncharacterized protein YwqG